MTIMRPSQHGQVGLPGSMAAAVGWPSGFAAASSSRARAMLLLPVWMLLLPV